MAKIVCAPYIGVFVVWAPYPFTYAEADWAVRSVTRKQEGMRIFECKTEDDAVALQLVLNS